MKFTRSSTLLLAGIMTAFCCSTGNAEIIYSNSFVGGPAGTIYKTSPTLANAYNLSPTNFGVTGTATWICTYTNFALDGTVYGNGNISSNAGCALLPFTPKGGCVYYLTASLTVPAAMPNYVQLGFAQTGYASNNVSLSRFNDTPPKGYASIAVREGTSGAVNQLFVGPNATVPTGSATNMIPTPGTYTYTIILNTFGTNFGMSTITNWTTSAFLGGTIVGTNVVGGVQFGTGALYTTPPPIGFAGIGQTGFAGQSTNGIHWNYWALSTPLTPVVIQQPVSVAVGGNFAYSMSALANTNGRTLSYQWYSNNIPFVNGGAIISGATSNVLTVNPLTAGNAYTNCYVVATNTFGAVTSSIVFLNQPLTITQQPVSATNVIGGSYTETVAVTGSAPVYQWYTNNVAIGGATSSTLTFNPVSISNDSTNYYVIVTNLLGSVTSSVASLSVYPIITQQPLWATNVVGTAFTDTVVANADPNNGSLYYQWYTNGVPLANGGNISGADTSSLTINPVLDGNAGTNYYVVVTNVIGAVTSSIVRLTVYDYPAITQQPVSATNVVGTAFTNTVLASANIPLFYQWYTNGVPLVNGGSISGAKTNSLIINPVSLSNDSTNYYLVVTNLAGAVTSSVVSLTVYPFITQQPLWATNAVGTAYTNTVLASADANNGTLYYQWYTNGVPLINGGSISGATTNILVINPVSTNNAGTNYYVVVTNVVGAVTSSVASLTVYQYPIVAFIVTNSVTAGSTWKIALTDLATQAGWSDPASRPVTFSSVNAASVLGTNVSSDATYIYYNGVMTVEDHFGYAITNGVLGANGTVYLEAVSTLAASSISSPGVDGGGHPTFSGQGIANYTYGVESATSLSGPWVEAGSVTADTHGAWSFTDAGQVNPPTIFYRLYYPDNPSSPPQ